MSGNFIALEPSHLRLDAHGTPYSERYEDVYHARQGAIAQARHVFIQGNGLPDRWRGRAAFTVCETGFGLGRNFLALWQAWREDVQRSTRLHFLSFEAFPFSRGDLALACRDLPAQLQGLADQLLAAWPTLLPGVHRMDFENGSVTLTLHFGPIERMARQAQAGVDAFFLDGFSPRKNPQMWSPHVFGQLVRIALPGATAATWCVNGQVRRHLQEAGFIVTKAAGFGGKLEMTVASLRPGLGRGLLAQKRGRILIVGAGPAGAGMAHALALRGREVVVVDPALSQGKGASHRGHLAAGLTPLVSRDDDIRARLSRAGVLRALQRWQSLPQEARPLRTGTVELLQEVQQQRERRLTLEALRFPEDWVCWMDASALDQKLGFPVGKPGIYFSDGQLVRPEPLLAALLDSPGIDCQATQVIRIEQAQDGWLAHTVDGRSFTAATVVLANAHGAKELLAGCFSLAAAPKVAAGWRMAGQISFFRADAWRYDPAAVLAADGYWLPQVQGIHVGGSTYSLEAQEAVVTAAGHDFICGQVARMLGINQNEVASWLNNAGGWAGWRAMVAGRLPVFGPVPGASGLWLACAYGSRGFTWSALAAEVLAATLEGEPLPLERALLSSVSVR